MECALDQALHQSFGIDRVVVRVVSIPLNSPFRFGHFNQVARDHIIVEMHGQGLVGYGEAGLLKAPVYNHETEQTGLHVLSDFAAPWFFSEKPNSPEALNDVLAGVLGHPISKGGFEMAYWDWLGKAKGLSLRQLLGGVRTTIPVGASLGMVASVEEQLDNVASAIELGYKRVKLKINPSSDFRLIREIRKVHADIPLTVDGNSSFVNYERSGELLQPLDEFNLLYIEQPFDPDDLVSHSTLQKSISTAVCLDESIESLNNFHSALALDACRVLNIKPVRVGGIWETLKINQVAMKTGVPCWCGGLLETGVGRAACLAVASLPNFEFPADISPCGARSDYELISKPLCIQDGEIAVPTGPGLGVEVDVDQLERFTVVKKSITP